MSGKKINLTPGGHPRSQAHWVPPVSIGIETWTAIESRSALGRALASEERQWMHDGIALHRAFMHDARNSQVSTQDVKAALAALAGTLSPVLALRGFAKADGSTHAEIQAAMVRSGIRDAHRIANPTGADVSRFANEALTHGIPTRRSRPDRTGMLARLILQWWDDLAGPPCAIATKPGYATPIVVFADAVFKAAGAPSCDLPAVKRRLLKAKSA